MDLKALRREYLLDGLERGNLADDPYEQFERWMAQFLEIKSNKILWRQVSVWRNGERRERPNLEVKSMSAVDKEHCVL